jgi:preprotein translocase subunit SecA
MDDLRQSVQGAVYEQKDPLLIYKFESFELFKSLIGRINQEVVSFLFRGGLPEETPKQVRQAPAHAPKQPKLKESHPGLDAPVQAERVGAHGNTPVGGTPNPTQATPRIPVMNEGKQYGRNDAVTVRNGATGEEKNVKYKQALPLLSQGWQIVD